MRAMDSSPDTEDRLDGVPLWLFALITSLAILGIIYSLAIIIFNLKKAKNKIIKMTSPNINVVMLTGVILGYCCMILFGLDTGYVSRAAMEKLQTACVFILSLSFTLIYGCLFAKSWRIFLVFKNINFNGKLTRDEHLLIGILVMLLIDLGILLPWYFVDPIQCTNHTISAVYEGKMMNYRIDDCHSDMLGLWIGLLYSYKALLIIAGLYFTWQTRNITLPSLKDAKMIYVVVFMIITMALVSLPTILISQVGMKIRYATGGLVIWIVLTVTVSLLFAPKIILERKNKAASNNVSAFNFLFSESMRKTQEAVKKCSLCFCCGDATESDRYVQEMLGNEIETLKRTIKQKDASIRELNDRLYIGTEKFQEYLTNPKSNRSVLQAMQDKYESRKTKQSDKTESQHNNEHQRESYSVPIQCPKPVPASHSNGLMSRSVIDDTYMYSPQATNRIHSERIRGNDSYLPNNISPTTLPRQHHPQRNDINSNYSNYSSHPNLYKPIQTVSNGSIPSTHHVRATSQTSQPISSPYVEYNRSHSRPTYQPTADVQHSDNWRSFSPNQDSAFDDNTPSSDGYDKHSGNRAVYDHSDNNNRRECSVYDRPLSNGKAGIAQDRQFSQIDLGAMEYDAVKNFQRTPSLGCNSESVIAHQGYYNNYNANSDVQRVSVSQI